MACITWAHSRIQEGWQLQSWYITSASKQKLRSQQHLHGFEASCKVEPVLGAQLVRSFRSKYSLLPSSPLMLNLHST